MPIPEKHRLDVSPAVLRSVALIAAVQTTGSGVTDTALFKRAETFTDYLMTGATPEETEQKS